MAGIDAESTCAVLVDMAGTRCRSQHLGSRRVNRDVALLDSSLRAAFGAAGDVVCRLSGDVWVAFTGGNDPEGHVRGVAESYAETTPFSRTWRIEARLPDGEFTTTDVTGAGVIQRAVRCAVRTLTGEESVESQVERMRAVTWKLPLDTLVRLGEVETTEEAGQHPFIRLYSMTDILCPFCRSRLMTTGEAIGRANGGLLFDPSVGPLRPGDAPVKCGGCAAMLGAEEPW